MRESALDPANHAVEIKAVNGQLGIGFIREQDYFLADEIHGLKVIHNGENISVRLAKVNGKEGFVFEE
jgi:hypothetical protein